MTRETTLGGDNIRFQPTAWTLVRDVEAAKDLTQGFFGSLLERDFLNAVDEVLSPGNNILIAGSDGSMAESNRRTGDLTGYIIRPGD